MGFFSRKKRVSALDLDPGEETVVREAISNLLGKDGIPASEAIADETYRVFGGGELARLAKRRMMTGDLEGAKSSAMKALAAFPESPDVWLVGAEVQIARGELSKVTEMLAEAEKLASASYASEITRLRSLLTSRTG